jgi:hypothetical protein
MDKILTLQHPRWNEFAETLSKAVLSKRCHHDHRHAKQIMTSMGDIDVPASVEFFASRGGFCELNVAFSEDDAA